jgi:hypothetical protein
MLSLNQNLPRVGPASTPIDPIPEDRAPTDHSQDPWEGRGGGQDNVWTPS